MQEATMSLSAQATASRQPLSLFSPAKMTTPTAPAPTGIAFGSFRLIPAQFLLRDNKPVHLGIDHVWPDVTVEEVSVRVHVAAIRKALRDGQFRILCR
jgi:hypothetical protein